MAFERTLVRGPLGARTHQHRVGPETAAFSVRVQRNFSFTLAEVLGDSSNSSPRAPAQTTAQAGRRSATHTPLRPQQLAHMLNVSASPQMLTQSTGRRGGEPAVCNLPISVVAAVDSSEVSRPSFRLPSRRCRSLPPQAVAHQVRVVGTITKNENLSV